MRKIELGKNPESFEKEITVRLPEGGTTKMKVLFKYRTRKQMAQYLNELTASGSKFIEDSELKDVITTIDDNIKSDADTLMLTLAGWGLSHEFNRENVEQFCDEMPDAALDIMDAYVAGNNETRLGN